jgi:hypothetical protein
VIFIDGNDLRAAEIRAIAPGITFAIEPLQAAFSTSAPEPENKARDKVLASSHPECFAEAVDLTTMEGKSLRLELDSENENRFCKWWRETPAQMQLRVALRRNGEIQIFAASCAGRIADKPFGPHLLGWDRLFVPADEDDTLAQLCAAGVVVPFRHAAYTELARALGV